MFLLRTISFVRRQNPCEFRQPLLRALCTCLQIEPHMTTEMSNSDQNLKTQIEISIQKPLDVLFKQAVGLSPKPEDNERESEESEVKRGLRNLEREISELTKDMVPEAKTLRLLFTSEEKAMVFMDLSPDMEMFVSHLYSEGYLKDANFFPGNRLDFSCFGTEYSRRFIKFAAIKFGKDHHEIAQCLSRSDLKVVALFGCPVLSRKDVSAAKRLRKFFQVEEATVCLKCILKESCPFVDQIGYDDDNVLRLVDIIRVITLYALGSSPPQLIVPDEVKVSVSHLLNEIVKLSKSGS